MKYKISYDIIYLGDEIMPTHILVEDIIDEMLENISYIKLNTYIKLDNDNK